MRMPARVSEHVVFEIMGVVSFPLRER